MNNYMTAMIVAFFGVLVLLTAGSVTAQNQTSSNQTAGSNETGTYNLTSTELSGTGDESGQISQRSR